jgi:glycine/serine hydroxymethyltransferase
MGEDEMDRIAGFHRAGAAAPEDAHTHRTIKTEVEELCRKFPLYPERRA